MDNLGVEQHVAAIGRLVISVARLILECTFKDSDGLPKDDFVNVFYMNSSEVAVEGERVQAVEKVVDFYTNMTEGGNPVGAYLSPVIFPRVGVVKLYDFADAKPRPILLQATFVIANSLGDGGLPEEVALCLSYYTDRNLPSHRGRIYIGPLASGAANESPVRPQAGFMAALADGGTRLIGPLPESFDATVISSWDPHGAAITDPPAAATGVVDWALFSRKLNTQVAIEHGWVDNEWDSQRRRRIAATSRVLYPPA